MSRHVHGRFARTLAATLFAGVLHTAVSALLWTWFDFTTRVAGNELFLTYVAVGAFLLGALPAVAVASARLVTPVLVVTVSFLLSAYGTWSLVASGLTPVDPTPFGWYLLGWPVVVGGVLLVGAGEYGLRRHRQRPNTAVGE